mgnify:CR=1 FL=1
MNRNLTLLFLLPIVIVIVIKFIMNDPVNRLIGNIAIKKLRVIKVLLLNEIKFIIRLIFL